MSKVDWRNKVSPKFAVGNIVFYNYFKEMNTWFSEYAHCKTWWVSSTQTVWGNRFINSNNL